MQSPELPANEQQRLLAVSEYCLLDTLPEIDYDNITKLVSTICNVPITLITLLDQNRNFFKSNRGIPFRESPRDISFCGHAILSDEPIFIIEDARIDNRFKSNPLVLDMGAVFYAGVNLINPEGYALGTLCVFDYEPRILTETQKDALLILGKQVVNLMELRRQNLKLEVAQEQLKQHNRELQKFASHISHDLKSPLANIISLTNFLKDDLAGAITASAEEYLGYIEESALILKDYIDGILKHYQADELLNYQNETLKLSDLCSEIQKLLLSKNDILLCKNDTEIVNINRAAITQILLNLVDNALKYNTAPQRRVSIEYVDDAEYHKFVVVDNGIGIKEDQQEKIFQLFATIPHENIKPSTGIGLNTVKTLVTKLQGSISVKSEMGRGSAFTVTMAK
ncbi:sensor histidine kinase [Flavobacterium ardleyense]|uniref:sensor histidine kinase n=1 Tax=Flavobacterium ardleyense TaxID=2038737 RepID=UPI00298D2121|nr:GAF domain-containing sensor histidine kinase [Flavobacterium ardleyense]